jgi:hypothetical protein
MPENRLKQATDAMTKDERDQIRPLFIEEKARLREMGKI